MVHIKKFSKLTMDDVNLAGGKGASLGELTRNNIPVPDGFVVLSTSFEAFMKESNLSNKISNFLKRLSAADSSKLKEVSKKIQELIFEANISAELEKEIISNYKELNSEFVAVRSSATAEDGSENAWAGQLDTFLNTTQKNLLNNIKKCWSSLFTPRAIFYRIENNLVNEKISVAVVVQKMVQSEVSGIAFSIHPISQNQNQIVIEAGLGLGEAVVSGEITPDNFIIEKDKLKITEKNIHSQEKQLVKNKDNENTWVKTTNGSSQKINDSSLIELAKIIQKIENHYKFPCDIEWAIEDNNIYITQSRPITTINKDIINFNEKKYQRMFELPGCPFLVNDIFTNYYKNLDVVTVFKDSSWTTYMPNNIMNQCLDDGVKLYSNINSIEKYHNEFEDYKKEVLKYFESILNKEELSQKEILDSFDLLSKHFSFYSKTEFFYLDKVFNISIKDKKIQKNLENFDSIKNEGRAFLNKLFLETNSILNQFLEKISLLNSISIDDLFNMGIEEISAGVSNKKNITSKVLERKNDYITLNKSNKKISYEGKEAETIISKFIDSLPSVDSDSLKGIIANQGKYTGKVKIFDYGFHHELVPKLIEEMEAGDVLVAETTSPELMMACEKAGAIITNQGGMMSHAAIVSREMNIPCIVGLNSATKTFKDGDIVEVNANNGEVKIIK